MRILSDADVRAVLPMAEAITVVRSVMIDHAAGRTEQPLRTHMAPPGMDGVMLLKPAALTGHDPALGVKLLTIVPSNAGRQQPVINGVVVIFNPVDGTVQALLDGAAITELRTAAASAVATDVLAKPAAGDLAILGAGVQARAHLAAMAEIRDLRRVRVWSRTAASAHAFAAWATQPDAGAGWPQVEVADTVTQAIGGADLICTVSSSGEPILAADGLHPECHINAVGAFQPDRRELASSLMATASRIVVDSVDGAMSEAGDILLAIADGALPTSFQPLELGPLLGTVVPQARRPGISVYKSLGMAIQDVAAASHAVAQALERGIGTDVPLV